MKTIIFSDTHLTNRFDGRKFNFLVKVINSADQIIINGDFWDSWFTDFDHFVSSQWKNLFPLLLNKKTIYIYGNHDSENKCDDRVYRFSVKQADTYEATIGKLRIRCCHGDTLIKGKRPKWLEIYGKILDKTDSSSFGSFLHNTLHFGERLGFKLFGVKYMTQSSISRHSNQLMKSSHGNGQWLICGDTHCPELDNTHHFANTGTINYGIASYVTIDGGKLLLHKESYK